jgi:hypothetical protein
MASMNVVLPAPGGPPTWISGRWITPPHSHTSNGPPLAPWAELSAPAAPAPQRQSTTWADFLRSQADALLACDFFETRTLTEARLYIFAVIEHATRRIRILGATAHPTAAWVVQLGRNLVMDLEDVDSRARFLVRDRDSKFTQAFAAVLTDSGLRVVKSGVRMPRMNSIMERWIQTCRRHDESSSCLVPPDARPEIRPRSWVVGPQPEDGSVRNRPDMATALVRGPACLDRPPPFDRQLLAIVKLSTPHAEVVGSLLASPL